MKRSIEASALEDILSDDAGPEAKVVLVEREERPFGVPLVSPVAVAKKTYIDSMDLSAGTSQVVSAIQANSRNKLDIIGRQMKNLQDLMLDVFQEAKLSLDLHSVACNFVKKPGHIYHLYERPSGQRYLGMLSPEEWQAPHPYIGSFMLEADSSWTPAKLHNGRYQGSDSESNHSEGSIHQGPAPTPGHGLDRSASNSPNYTRSQDNSPQRGESRASRSRSRSGSPASSARSRSRSGSAESNKSAASRRSEASNTSRKSRSRSAASSRGSNRSGSGGSRKSQRSGSNRSESPARSQRSRSRSSSAGSKKRSRSRSGSAGSNKSRSRSRSSNKSRSRSRSAGSNKSGSRSPSRSRSRSGSAASNRSNRSKSAESNKSQRSRSPSLEKGAASRDNSRSNSPNLQIDEPGSPGSGNVDKRKRDSSEERSPKKKSRIIDSDSEGEGDGVKEGGKEVSAAAIFGDDADDISSEEENDKASSDREARRSDDEDEGRRSEEENEGRPPEDDEDKENEPEPIPETRIDVEIPKISCDLGRDIHFVKLPNFLSVETRPFDPETYEDEIDEEETLDEEGRARLKLKVENTIRWKEVMDKEGNVKKESNARLVRWSDGSYSLHLGSEIFDVYKQPLQGDHNHLFIRQGTGLQGQAVFRTKLSFRPHSTESFTHRKMTLSLADRSQKTSGIKILSQVGADPDHDRKQLLKKEEEKLRQTVRTSKPRTRKGDGGARSHNSNVYREEEGSDEEGAISLNAIKNKYKSGGAGPAKGGAIYSSDEEGSDIESRRARKLDKAKALKDSESSEESE